MCNFFSFKTDGDHNLYYFSAEQRHNHVTYPDGQIIDSYDSHTSIEAYYGLNEHKWLSGEYNLFTDKLVLDTPGAAWDEDKVRKMLSGVDWRSLCGDLEGAKAFIASLKDIQWFKSDGTIKDGPNIKVFKTRDAAWDAARDAALDAAWAAAWDAARDAAWDAARDAAWDAAWDAALDAAWDAARDAALDAARVAALFIQCIHVCDSLQVEQKHIDYIKQSMDICRHGYGVICDVNGMLYCYEKL